MEETGFEPISRKRECIAQTIVPLGVLITRSCFYLFICCFADSYKKKHVYIPQFLTNSGDIQKTRTSFTNGNYTRSCLLLTHFHMWDPSLLSDTMEIHKWRKTLVHCGIIPFSLKNYWQQYWYNYDTQEHNHSPATNS